MSKIIVDPTGLFTYENRYDDCVDVGVIVFENCVLKKKMGNFEVGSHIEQISIEVIIHLETLDGHELFKTGEIV